MAKVNYIREYTEQIRAGTVTVGMWIRSVYDYIEHGLEEGLFFYDEDKAHNAVDWIEEHCFHTEGILAPSNLKLELWQKAIVSCIFGIVNDKGYRQFREVVLIVSRKNGKSLFASAIAKYTWFVDGGYGAKIYCLAPKLDQADIIYNNIWQMTMLDPEWQALKLEIEGSKVGHERRTKSDSGLARHRQTDLCIPETNSIVKKLAFAIRSSDGFNPSLTICDEIASWRGDAGLKQYEVMKSGMGARPESLLMSCSTSGYENDGIYDEIIKRSTSFLLGNSKETKLLPFLYMVDDVRKWNDIEELKKSNPNLGVSVSEEYLTEEIAIAEGSLSKKGEFITKYCNIKQNSSQAWLRSEVIDRAYGDEIDLCDFTNCYCVGGIDLSRTTDLTSCCVVVEKDGILNVVSKFFLPAEKIEEATARDGLPYDIYIKRGLLQPSGDNFIDYHDCLNWFKSLVTDYKLYPLQIGYDRYCAQYLVQEMEQMSFHMDDVFQGFNLTPVIREFEGTIKDGRINIGNNDLLKAHLLNTGLKMEAESEKCKIIKVDKNGHIDGTAALLDALTVRQKWWNQIGRQLKNER